MRTMMLLLFEMEIQVSCFDIKEDEKNVGDGVRGGQDNFNKMHEALHSQHYTKVYN